jgi:hypothetical protein
MTSETREHEHAPGCGYDAAPHRDHAEDLVRGRPHHPHGNHCDDGGAVEVVRQP